MPTVLIGHVYLAADRCFDPGCTIITCMAAISKHLPRDCRLSSAVLSRSRPTAAVLALIAVRSSQRACLASRQQRVSISHMPLGSRLDRTQLGSG